MKKISIAALLLSPSLALAHQGVEFHLEAAAFILPLLLAVVAVSVLGKPRLKKVLSDLLKRR